MGTLHRIECASDIMRLEDTIRRLLECEAGQCAFLQSAPYKQLHIALLLRLSGVVSHDAPQCLPMGGGFWLKLAASGLEVEVCTRHSDNHGVLRVKRKEQRYEAQLIESLTKRKQPEVKGPLLEEPVALRSASLCGSALQAMTLTEQEEDVLALRRARKQQQRAIRRRELKRLAMQQPCSDEVLGPPLKKAKVLCEVEAPKKAM